MRNISKSGSRASYELVFIQIRVTRLRPWLVYSTVLMYIFSLLGHATNSRRSSSRLARGDAWLSVNDSTMIVMIIRRYLLFADECFVAAVFVFEW